MINIDGLTTTQRNMLHVMWGLETTEDLNKWMRTLTKEEFNMAIVLKELLLAACFDNIQDTDIAHEYLLKFRA